MACGLLLVALLCIPRPLLAAEASSPPDTQNSTGQDTPAQPAEPDHANATVIRTPPSQKLFPNLKPFDPEKDKAANSGSWIKTLLQLLL
ncbi:MAG: hypothetical protein Q7I92_05710 [Humidesulfovibrio sp.]|nr:hypothetical protein [Humidesulfovibrio sp.]